MKVFRINSQYLLSAKGDTDYSLMYIFLPLELAYTIKKLILVLIELQLYTLLISLNCINCLQFQRNKNTYMTIVYVNFQRFPHYGFVAQ